jgi:hypothetical protein
VRISVWPGGVDAEVSYAPPVDGESDLDEGTWLRDETGGVVYLRLTTNPTEHPGKRVDDAFRQDAK